MPDFGESLDTHGGQGGGRYEYEGRYDPDQPSVANGRVSPEEWAEYLARRKKNGILFALGLLGGTSALGALGPMFGAGSAGTAATGTGLAGEIMGTGGVTPLLGAGTTPLVGGAGAGAAGFGGTTAATTGLFGLPLPTTPITPPPLTGGATTGAATTLTNTAKDLVGGKSGGLFGDMNARDWTSLIAGLTGLIGGAVAGKKNNGTLTPNTLTSDPQLAKLLATMQGRLDKSEPLIESIMAMANGLLPTQYQKGGGGMP